MVSIASKALLGCRKRRKMDFCLPFLLTASFLDALFVDTGRGPTGSSWRRLSLSSWPQQSQVPFDMRYFSLITVFSESI